MKENEMKLLHSIFLYYKFKIKNEIRHYLIQLFYFNKGITNYSQFLGVGTNNINIPAQCLKVLCKMR